MSKSQKKKTETGVKKKGDQMPLRWFRCPDDLWAKVEAEAGETTFASEIVRDALRQRYQK